MLIITLCQPELMTIAVRSCTVHIVYDRQVHQINDMYFLLRIRFLILPAGRTDEQLQNKNNMNLYHHVTYAGHIINLKAGGIGGAVNKYRGCIVGKMVGNSLPCAESDITHVAGAVCRSY